MPHTHTSAHDTIVKYFLDSWSSTSYVDYDPNILKGETGESIPPDGTDSWVRITVQHQVGSQISLGTAFNRRFRREGLVWVQVFTTLNIGTYTGRNLGQTALNIFEGKNVDGIWFRDGIVTDAGSDGQWYQHIMKIEFIYDEIK